MRCDDVPRSARAPGADGAPPDAVPNSLNALRDPASDDRPDVLLVVDAHVTMQVWQETVDELAASLARQPGLGRVSRVPLLSSDDTEPARIRLAELPPAVGSRRVVLVVTDGLAAGWRSDAVLPLLQVLGRSEPVAVLHLLPQRLWGRGGLDVHRMRLRAERSWTPNAELLWELHTSPLEAVDDADARAGVVPVPVLELAERSTSAWVDLVAGRVRGWAEMSGIRAREWKRRQDAARALPWVEDVPDPGSAVPAWERVSEFRAAASPTAFALATRLAAAPLTLPVMRAVCATVPGAGPAHLTELLMSGLVRPAGAAAERADDVVFVFGPDIRQELLALSRRRDTARVLRDVRPLVVAGTEGPEAADPDFGAPYETAAVPLVTRRNVAFLRVELLALRALSGRFLPRAERLAEALRAYDHQNTVSLRKGAGARDRTRVQAADSAPEGRGTTSEGATAMTATQQPAVESGRSTQPRIWGNVPPRNPNFTGRVDLLEMLSDRLRREGTTTVLPEAIHGMGGVGKTQLAIEYAYRHQSEYDIVWWIPAERPGQIGQALVELAQRLGLVTSAEANIAGPAVREALREGRPYSRWLLIFDNADSPERVRDYFPTGGSGTILVTSRNRRWSLLGSSLEVDVFTREESKELLRRSGPHGDDLDDAEADRLAEALGDLPLALEQAAAWRAETGMPVSEYLRLFEHKRSELLEVSPPPDYQLPVAAAWNVSLDHLETRSLTALRLLQLCSYFAPDPISRSIFAGLGGSSIDPELDRALNDPMRLARAIREINRYSLARIDHRTNSIEMHRLVQAVLMNRMSPEEQTRMRNGAHTLLAAADPKGPNQAANWPRYAELYGHVIASGAVESDQPWVRELVMNVAKYLWYWGDHKVAREFTEQAHHTWTQKFGEEDQQTLLMAWWLGFLYLKVGRYDDASRVVARLRDVYDRTAPVDRAENREDALVTLNLEAAVRRVQGDFAAGAEIDEFAYGQARRAFGEDDPTTLVTAHNLGVSLRLVGDFPRALEFDRRTHAMKTRLFGRDHQQALVTEASVAVDVRETGDYVGARALQQAVVDGYRTAFGPRNPTTLETMRQLSEACRKEGDHATALELARETFQQFTRRYGSLHPDALTAELALSVALRQNGDLEEARERGEKACERFRQIFHADHPHVVAADVDLAVTLRRLGLVQEARRLDEPALASLTERLGEGHPIALACAINLASDLSALGEVRESRELGERTLALCRERLGEDHPTTLVCAANLALDLVALGDETGGRALREDALARMERVLDEPRMRTADAAPHPATVQVRAGQRNDCDIDPMPM